MTYNHCVKSVQIRSFFWSAFSCIRSKYKKIWTRKYSVFGHFSRSVMLIMHRCVTNNAGQRYLTIEVNCTKAFVSYLSITWIMTHWIQGNSEILSNTRITWITNGYSNWLLTSWISWITKVRLFGYQFLGKLDQQITTDPFFQTNSP